MSARSILLALLLLAPLSAACAADLQAQRESFRTLLEAAERGRLADHGDELARLEEYPLYPYLLAADLTWRLRHESQAGLDDQVRTFIETHPDLAAAETLRQRWVRDLARRDRWELVREYVQNGDGTALQCLAMTARIRTGATSEGALAGQALTFWNEGRSQPDECDPVFEWLEQRGALTAERIRHRARLAVEGGNFGLARYLARKLPGEAAEEVERWLHIVRNPGDLRHARHLDPDIAFAAFKRLALADLEGAAKLQPKLADRLDLPSRVIGEMQRYVALLYAQDHDSRALAWFHRLAPEDTDAFARGWRIRSALYHGEWQQALDWIQTLPPDEAGEEEWRYWRARALAALGRTEEADAGFAALAGERSYHGYLAADAADLPYSLNRRPLETDPSIREALLRKGGILRARELHALDMRNHARAEWASAISGLSPAELRQAALLAHDWQWHERAIVTLVRADYWDDLDIRYPLPHLDAVRRAAEDTGVEPAYILAIMRTESLFAPDVQSPAGALGLMQLMPGTARKVARDASESEPGSDDLLDPETSIRLGSRYLKAMRERFGGHPALAGAAYNAGPHRVERWLPEATVPADLWIANIPYTETREYVQRAMAHMTVFEVRLERPISRLSQRLPPVPGMDEIDCRPQSVC